MRKKLTKPADLQGGNRYLLKTFSATTAKLEIIEEKQYFLLFQENDVLIIIYIFQ